MPREIISIREQSATETELPLEKIKDFFELSDEEREKLKVEVAKHQGEIRLFVHPYHEGRAIEKQKPGFGSSKPEKVLKIENFLARLLAGDFKKAPPLLIMEEQKNIEELKQSISVWLTSNSKQAYLVPTYPKSPEPKDTPYDEEKYYDHSTMDMMAQDTSWQKFTNILKGLHVTKVKIAGMYLSLNDLPINNSWLLKGADLPLLGSFQKQREKRAKTGHETPKRQKDYYLAQCAGTAASFLAKYGFEVRLSPFTHPDDITDVSHKENENNKN